VKRHHPRAGELGVWVLLGIRPGASPVTSERCARRPLGGPTGSRMEWIDWLISGLVAVAMGPLAIYALVMFALALFG